MGGTHFEKLRSVPLFAGLGEESLKRILEHATEFEVEAGHVLVQPNQPGSGLFVIEEGSATVELKDRKFELEAGEFFGELALLDEGAVHTGRVCAATPLTGIAIRREDFDDLMRDEPAIVLSMLRVLARRLARATSH